MKELTLEELENTIGGGLTAAGVAVGLLGFGVGVVIGIAIVGAAYYLMKK